MFLFDVRCEVREAIRLSARNGEVTIAPGYYRLRGLNHLVRQASGVAGAAGMDIAIVEPEEGGASYPMTTERLAALMAGDQIEVTI